MISGPGMRLGIDLGGSVGIGTPGSLSRATRRLRNSNSVCLNGQMIVQDLEALLGRPVRIARNFHGDSSGVRGAAWLWDAPGS